MRARACAGGSGCKASQDQCRCSPAEPVAGSLVASGWGSAVRAARAVATFGQAGPDGGGHGAHGACSSPVVLVAGVGFGHGEAEVPLYPGQDGVPDAVHADLEGLDPGEVLAEAVAPACPTGPGVWSAETMRAVSRDGTAGPGRTCRSRLALNHQGSTATTSRCCPAVPAPQPQPRKPAQTTLPPS